MPLLCVQNLTTTFNTHHGAIDVCRNINLSIQTGATMGLIGETGCGKSVLGMSILRLLPREATVRGQVYFKQRNILTMDRATLQNLRGSKIALLPQSPSTSLNPVLKIGRQIAEGIKLHQKTNRFQAWCAGVELLKFFKIPQASHMAHVYPHQLSGGMKQRALTAVSMTGEPELLIADEPTKGLDALLRAQVVTVLKQMVRQTGAALLLITHDLKVAANLCDQIAVMYAGEIVEQGATGHILVHPRHPYTRGLMAALPENGMYPIPGYGPGLFNLPPGCKFHLRCSLAEPLCAQKSPPLLESGTTKVRCWFVDSSGQHKQNISNRSFQETAV
ncbi:ABC transporter ATP-binding protein [Desulfoscipio sp. XC116]|uniref:ABC transporter ATP-binding protein n=1 Tax=Desulfoscipio sp. XC116 TaxID=3144975 RepID=UPI00325B936D